MKILDRGRWRALLLVASGASGCLELNLTDEDAATGDASASFDASTTIDATVSVDASAPADPTPGIEASSGLDAGPTPVLTPIPPQPLFPDPWHAALAEAQIVEKSIQIGDVNLRFAEGPNNGPPLLLLHAQHMEWYSYSRVLPELSKSFHVFAVSYHGHGLSTSPPERMNAADIGADLTTFIATVIKEPVFLTGNSSGGLLSVWLAANQPAWVRKVVLEDPPLFTAVLPRLTTTVAYKSFITCHNFLPQTASHDLLVYWLNANQAFVVQQAGQLGLQYLLVSIDSYRALNPGARLELLDVPDDTLRLFIRGLDVNDANFGDAFYDGRWNLGFDHGDALKHIVAPTLLMHANFSYLPDGTLNGAMDDDDAALAMSYLHDGTLLTIDSEHVVHLAHPTEYISIVRNFFLGQ